MPYKDPLVAKQKARERYVAKKWYWKNPDGTWKRAPLEKARAYHNKSYYKHHQRNLEKQRQRRLAQQKRGVCPICRREAKLVWDHDHQTDKFRDWLCQQCNVMLGMAHDQPEVLYAGAKFIEQHRQNGRIEA
jgi:hypothetical protein